MTETLDLINKALQYAKEARLEFTNDNLGISEPLTPNARRALFYLQIRENINRGCKQAVKLIPVNWKRSVAYSILMRACIDVFHYKKSAEVINKYNDLLDSIIGTH